jgi:AcrR family transcriptional regulator
MARSAIKRRRAGPGRLSAQDAAQLGDRLLDAAGTLFQENGYARTTMEGIAREAQASTKTVYSRYQNKAEILAAVIRRLVDRIIERGIAGLEQKLDTSDLRTFLVEVGMRFALNATAKQTVAINRLVLAEAPQFPELVQVYAGGPERARNIIRSALEQAAQEGKFPLMPEPGIASSVFFDMTTATPRMRALLGMPMSRKAIETHVDAAVTVFLRGCGYEKP